MMKWKIVLLAFAVAVVAADPKKAYEKCEDSLKCSEEKLTRIMDNLNEKEAIPIYGDMIYLEKISVEPAEEEPETNGASSETDALLSRVDRFFRSRRIHVQFPSDGSSADIFGRALGEKKIDVELKGLTQGASEGRTKLKRIILPILLALKLKAMIVLPIVITVIGLIGIKGLGAGVAALLLSGAVALKALLTPPPPPRVSYGIVKPHDVHHEHWHRSQEELNQPYRGWSPEYNEQFQGYQGLP